MVTRYWRQLLTLAILLLPTSALSETTPIHLEAGKHVVLIRHALAPGIGDPANFVLNDCSTQRNLDARGRDQSARIGRRLNALGSDFEVFSSQWCRCLETAELMSLGPVNQEPMLNSFFREGDPDNTQTILLKSWLTNTEWKTVPVLITHQVNITALTGVYPISGEILILSLEDNLDVIQQIETD